MTPSGSSCERLLASPLFTLPPRHLGKGDFLLGCVGVPRARDDDALHRRPHGTAGEAVEEMIVRPPRAEGELEKLPLASRGRHPVFRTDLIRQHAMLVRVLAEDRE